MSAGISRRRGAAPAISPLTPSIAPTGNSRRMTRAARDGRRRRGASIYPALTRRVEKRRLRAALHYWRRVAMRTAPTPKANSTAARTARPVVELAGAMASGQTRVQQLSGVQTQLDTLQAREPSPGQLKQQGLASQQALSPGGQKQAGGPRHCTAFSHSGAGEMQRVQPGLLTLNIERCPGGQGLFAGICPACAVTPTRHSRTVAIAILGTGHLPPPAGGVSQASHTVKGVWRGKHSAVQAASRRRGAPPSNHGATRVHGGRADDAQRASGWSKRS